MELLKIYQQKLSGIKKEVPQWAKEAILQNAEAIVFRLKAFQLTKGLDSLGNVVGTYAERTQEFAEKEDARKDKIPGSPYNFEWTGETFDNLMISSVNKSQKTYKFRTVAYKQKLLEELYGEIFDLTEENNEWVNKNIIEPFVANKIQEAIAQFI